MDAVILALVALFKTVVATSVPVYDGPTPTEENAAALIMVGTSGEDEDGASASRPNESDFAEFDQEFGEIQCISYATNGDANIPLARSTAQANAYLCIAAINADRSLAGLLKGGARAQVTALALRQAQSGSGAEVRLTFTVSYVNTL